MKLCMESSSEDVFYLSSNSSGEDMLLPFDTKRRSNMVMQQL